MLDRNQPRSKFNPGVGDVYANPAKPNLHHVVLEAKNGRVFLHRYDERGPCYGSGVSMPWSMLRADLEASDMEYFKKGEVPKRNRPVPPPDESVLGWSKSDPEWVALKKFLGPEEYRRRYVGPEKKAVSMWMRSWAEAEYDAMYACWPDVRDSYEAMVGEAALNGEDSEEYMAAAKENDAAVKKMEEAYLVWQGAYRVRRGAAAANEAADRAFRAVEALRAYH